MCQKSYLYIHIGSCNHEMPYKNERGRNIQLKCRNVFQMAWRSIWTFLRGMGVFNNNMGTSLYRDPIFYNNMLVAGARVGQWS